MTLAFRPLLAVTLMSFSCASIAAKKKPAAPKIPAATAACVDFYGHVNHEWLQAHPLPIGIQSFSRWDELNASALRQTRELLANSMRSGQGPASDLLADLSASAMDQARLDPSLRATAQPLLAQINAIRKSKDVAKVVASLHAAGVPALYGFDAVRDAETGQAHATLYPAGLGLPDPGYYTSVAPELQPAVGLYRSYLGQILQFSGVSPAESIEQANWAFALEQSLAGQMTSDSIDAITVAQAGKNFPKLLIPNFMQAQGAAPALINIRQPAFFRALDGMLAKPSIPQWQAYLRAQLMHSLAPAMARDLRQPYLAALSPAPSATENLTAAERLAAIGLQEAAELLSAAYVERYLARSHDQRADAIGESIRVAMGRAIDRASWLSEEARIDSRKKLAAMRLAIGKPTEPAPVTGLVFDRGSYAGNILALRRWNRSRSLGRLSSVVWPLPVSQAQPVIGYQPAENRLVATAAALQAPAFEGKSTASDYGSLGALLAQQMSLGFADYTETDGRRLAFRQAGLIPQFDAYPATSMLKVNSRRMQRQNAADLAGVEIAWDAFNAQGPATLPASQEFFRAWGSLWARQDSPAALAAAQTQSAFSPARWRANGPLANTPAFAQAFACQAGQPMVRPATEQVAIWR